MSFRNELINKETEDELIPTDVVMDVLDDIGSDLWDVLFTLEDIKGLYEIDVAKEELQKLYNRI